MSLRLVPSDPPGGGPGQQPDMPPTRPGDPARPEPLPLPPDSPRPTAPVREPEPAPAQPAGDPAPAEPTRLARARSRGGAKLAPRAPAAWGA
jgi:hypothetical protein